MLVIPASDNSSVKENLSQVIDLAKQTLSKNQLIVVLNDFDATVSEEPTESLSPFDTQLNPRSAKALSELEEKGVVIGAISNRSGEQIAKRYKNGGIKNPFIIGTYGMELYEGKSIIDERFVLYRSHITNVINDVKKTFLKNAGIEYDVAVEVESTVSSVYGKIYIENKGICDDFPSGLSQVYNLNEIDSSFRKSWKQNMADIFIQSLYKYEVYDSDLPKIWGISELGSIPGKDYSWSIGPIVKEGKAYGITKLLKAVDESGLGKQIGLVIYGGDENADAQAMQGANDLSKLSTGEGTLNVVGIWVNPGEEKEEVKEASNLEIKGVSKYADFLQNLSDSI